MLPELSKNIQDIAIGQSSFAETISSNYIFEIKPVQRNLETRYVFYYKEENTLCISFSNSNRVHLLDLKNGNLRYFDVHNSTVRSVQVSNHQIITSSWDGKCCVLDFYTLKLRLVLTEPGIMGRSPFIAVEKDHDYVYSYSYDSDRNVQRLSNTVRKFSLINGRLERSFEMPGRHLTGRRCGSCKIHKDRLYIVSDTGHLHIYDATSGQLLVETFFNDLLQSIVIQAELDLLILGGDEGHLYLCEASTGRFIKKQIKAHRYYVSDLILHSEKPEVLITNSHDGLVKFWHLPDLKLLGTAYAEGADCLWSVTSVNNPDLLIAGGDGQYIMIYDIKNLKEAKLKGRLFISYDSYVFFSAESNGFYASDLSLVQVRNRENNNIETGQLGDYLLKTNSNFRIFRDLFSSEVKKKEELQNKPFGFLQLT